MPSIEVVNGRAQRAIAHLHLCDALRAVEEPLHRARALQYLQGGGLDAGRARLRVRL